MKIERIVGTNIKGRTFDIDLRPTPSALVVGQSFTGKTAILQAIRLAVAGELPPPIGKSDRVIYSVLAGDPSTEGLMAVEAYWSDGQRTRLEWSANGKGQVKAQGTPRTDLAVDPVVLDPRSFFLGKTADERIQFILSRCKGATVDKGEIARRVGEIAASPASVRDVIVAWVVDRAMAMAWGGSDTDYARARSLAEILKESAKGRRDEMKRKSAVLSSMAKMTGVPPKMPSKEEMDDAASQVKRVTELLSSCRTKLKALRDSESDMKTIVDAQAKLDALDLAEPLKTEAEKEYDELSKAITGACAVEASKAESVASLESTLNRLSDGVCPHCRQNIPNAKQEMASIKRELKKAKKEHEEACSRRAELASRMDSLQDAVDSACEARARYASDLATADRLKVDVAMAKQRIEGRGKVDDEEGVLLAMEEATAAQLAKVSSDLAKLNEQVGVCKAHNQTREHRDALEWEVAKCGCEETVLKAAEAIVLDVARKAGEKAFGSVLKVANEFTDGILCSPIEFVDGEVGRRVSEADVERGSTAKIGSWLSWKAFSGTEEIVAMSAFAVALAADCKFKLVVMDELGRVDATLRWKIVERMTRLAERGVIDQFIGVDANADYWEREAVEGCNLITL